MSLRELASKAVMVLEDGDIFTPGWREEAEKLANALRAALAEPQPEIEQLKAERDALLAALKEAVQYDGGQDELFHACCGESFWTAHDVECWVPKAKAAIDAARGEK